jgi:hypothetical protein
MMKDFKLRLSMLLPALVLFQALVLASAQAAPADGASYSQEELDFWFPAGAGVPGPLLAHYDYRCYYLPFYFWLARCTLPDEDRRAGYCYAANRPGGAGRLDAVSNQQVLKVSQALQGMLDKANAAIYESYANYLREKEACGHMADTPARDKLLAVAWKRHAERVSAINRRYYVEALQAELQDLGLRFPDCFECVGPVPGLPGFGEVRPKGMPPAPTIPPVP